MWMIAFFSVLLLAIIIYAALTKKKTDRDEFMESNEDIDEDETRPHSPLR